MKKMMNTNLQRLKNFADYWHEIGLSGTLTLLRQRMQHLDVFELSVKGIPTTVYCRSQGSDFAVLRQVLGHQDAGIPLEREPTLIIDGGANVGYSSLVFARHYPTAQIIAVEPDKRNCEMFHKNCDSYPNIRLLEGAIWPTSSKLTITNPAADAFMFQVDESTETGGANEVPAYTIPQLLELGGGGRINLLKLDIEGAEKALFSKGTDEWLHRVDVIFVELHDRYVPGCTQAFDSLLATVEHTREKRGEYDCARLKTDSRVQ
jgi:FkbM family methyltransferase